MILCPCRQKQRQGHFLIGLLCMASTRGGMLMELSFDNLSIVCVKDDAEDGQRCGQIGTIAQIQPPYSGFCTPSGREHVRRDFPRIETAPLIDALIEEAAPVAIGVSGGKDSAISAFVTQSYLRERGHAGSCILIHSDLGKVEHKDSLPACQRLSDHLGLELIVVKRKAGDMMDRWLARWKSSVQRYQRLECVKLILPWSTASMRFCTSELKTAVICRDLVGRYPGQTILNVVGLRRQESTTRAKAPIYTVQTKLETMTHSTRGYNWHPILAWSLQDVLDYHKAVNFPLHRAYVEFGNSRVSCAYCILSSLHDLLASTRNPENHDIYREQVALEMLSSFSFQSGRWLGDVAPHLLSDEMQIGLTAAKRRAQLREEQEARIPKRLHFTHGWPTVMPMRDEARLLAEVRHNVSEIMQFSGCQYLDSDSILARYEELMERAVTRRHASGTPVVTQPSLWEVAS
jgi:3'-phosphoadenosine 5'-phosphosulfate sulfotransferase (PAPS reductase)/FAD synthetase